MNFPITQPNNGIVRQYAIDSLIVPQDTLELSLNVNFDTVGTIKPRKGITHDGTTTSQVWGLGIWRNNSGTTRQLLYATQYDATYQRLYKKGSGTYIDQITGVSKKVRFANLVDYTFYVNGVNALRSYNGTASGTTNCGSFPSALTHIAVFRNRLWAADAVTDKLYYSDVVTTSNTITGGDDFIQISPADGNSITGLWPTARMLCLFKENAIYRVYSINSIDPESPSSVGTHSQESIQEEVDGIYFHHSTGFYRFNGQNSEPISEAIRDIVEAILPGNYANICSWKDNVAIYWSIGSIYLNGQLYDNVILRRTTKNGVWTMYTYPVAITSATDFQETVNGDTLKCIATFASASSSNYGIYYDNYNQLGYDSLASSGRSDIFTEWTYHWQYMGAPDLYKTFSEITAIHENCNGLQIVYQIDMDGANPVAEANGTVTTTNKWRPIGEINQDLYQKYPFDDRFIRIRFRVLGQSPMSPWLFRTLQLFGLDPNGQEK